MRLVDNLFPLCLKFLLLNIRTCQRLEREINYYNIFSCSSLHLFESIEIPFNSNSQFVSSSLSIAFRFKSLLSLSLFFFKKKDSSKSKYINCNSFKFHFLFIYSFYISMAIPKLITSMVARFKVPGWSLCRPC